MKKIIIASHGRLAHELVNTSKMFVDSQNLVSLCIGTGEDLYEFQEKMKMEIFNNSYEEILVLVDLLGGTPFNTAAQVLHEFEHTKEVEIITGVNLPMLLEILIGYREIPLADAIQPAIKVGREGIKSLFTEINRKKKGDEDAEHCAQQN